MFHAVVRLVKWSFCLPNKTKLGASPASDTLPSEEDQDSAHHFSRIHRRKLSYIFSDSIYFKNNLSKQESLKSIPFRGTSISTSSASFTSRRRQFKLRKCFHFRKKIKLVFLKPRRPLLPRLAANQKGSVTSRVNIAVCRRKTARKDRPNSLSLRNANQSPSAEPAPLEHLIPSR